MKDRNQKTIVYLLWAVVILSALNFLGFNLPDLLGTWYHGTWYHG
jgi:hypothetical protein